MIFFSIPCNISIKQLEKVNVESDYEKQNWIVLMTKNETWDEFCNIIKTFLRFQI